MRQSRWHIGSSCGEKSVAVATDLGYYDDYIVDHLRGLDAVLIESNHDINMLQVGSYPYYLKQRILGRKGHLSNDNAGRLLGEILNDRMKAVMLGHLSRENNYEALAMATVCTEITDGDNPYKATDFPIQIAKRDEPSGVDSRVIHVTKEERDITADPETGRKGDSMKKTIITVVGKDTVGIIARVCTYLAENNVNILDISQTIVQGYFNMMMVTDATKCPKSPQLRSQMSLTAVSEKRSEFPFSVSMKTFST